MKVKHFYANLVIVICVLFAALVIWLVKRVDVNLKKSFSIINDEVAYLSDQKKDSYNNVIKVNDSYVAVGYTSNISYITSYSSKGEIEWVSKYDNSRFVDVISGTDKIIVIGYNIETKQGFTLNYSLDGKLLSKKDMSFLDYVKLIKYQDKYYIICYNKIVNIEEDGTVINTYEYGGSKYFTNMFYDAVVIDNQIIINAEVDIHYENRELSSDGLLLLSFNGKEYKEVTKYSNDSVYNFKYTEMTYLKDTLYLITENELGNMIAIDMNGRVLFKRSYSKGRSLKNYEFTSITNDGKNIYVSAKKVKDKKVESYIIIFDTNGDYVIRKVSDGYLNTIRGFDKKIIAVGNGLSFVGFDIVR